MTTRERKIQNEIRLTLGSRRDTRLFRNNVGVAKEQYRGVIRYIKYGLCTGSSDTIGWKSVVVTPEMVGRRIAVFVAIEVKKPGRNPTPEQRNFIDKVIEAGGIAGVARSVEQAAEIIDGEV